eukprot:GHVU01087242.1.p1 GENE.GHVU01087242.1~~GHVU01087242.1.p1  ORF type:complete len:275 (-),score=45.80 GHVU01087242.1:752-1576(-)
MQKCANKKAVVQQPGKGYINLEAHLKCCVGANYEEKYAEVSQAKNVGMTIPEIFSFVNDKEMGIFMLMTWIVFRNMPLSELDNPITRGMLKYGPVCAKSMRKYMLATVILVERAIAAILPSLFALIFDGWSCAFTHYLAIIASFMGKDKREEVLLAMGPLLDEEELDAPEHIEFLSESLKVYGKAVDDVVALVGDNCNVNKAISHQTGVALIGCGSHKFNLSVTEWLEEKKERSEAVVEVVHSVMVQLRCAAEDRGAQPGARKRDSVVEQVLDG